MAEIIDPFDKPAASKEIVDPFDKKEGPSRLKQALGSAASVLDFPLSAPGFALGTAANVARSAMDLAQGRPAAEAYAHGREVGGQVTEALSNPLQKVMGLFQASDEYAKAPLPQAMSKFSELIQSGAKKIEQKTGIPAAGMESVADVGMLAGGSKAAEVGKKLVSTAFKDKTTGEITPTGPKHPDEMKASTKDTHEQGFVDEGGKFVNRQEAITRAKETGQIPLDHKLENPPGEEPGLHSGDLRAAKDSKFALEDVGLKDQSETIYEDSQAKLKATPENVAKETEGLIRSRINDVAAKDRDIHNRSQEIVKAVPEESRRTEISYAIDSGDLSRLNDTERASAEDLKAKFKDIGERAVAAGVLKGMRENYISHIVDWEKSGKSATRELIDFLIGADGTGRSGISTSTKSRFGKERAHATFDDLNDAIKDSGLALKTSDAAEIYKTYARSMERAIENKKLVENLKDVRDESGAKMIRKVDENNPIPKGWEMFPSHNLAGFAVHPEIAKQLKFVFEKNDPGMLFTALSDLSQAVKRLNVFGSLFHAKSLLESGVFAGLTHTDISGVKSALKEYREGGTGDRIDSLIKSGLVLEIPEDVTTGILGKLGASADELLGKVGPKSSVFETSLTAIEKQTQGRIDKITWDYLHTGLKLQTALKEFEKAKSKNPGIDEAKLMQEVSRSVNVMYGGLNWFDQATQATTSLGKKLSMEAYSPNGRAWMQLLMFAPDWTVSTISAFKNALPRSFEMKEGVKGIMNPKTKEDYARRYQMRVAFTYLTLFNALNLMASGRNIWENDDPTRIEFKDGTSIQAAKHASEPVHWIKNPDQTFANKLGFWPRAAMVGFGGLEYASPTAPKLMDTSATSRIKAVAKGALPFQASSAVSSPSGEGLKRSIAGTLGFPIYGKTSEQRKQENRERAKQQQELRKEYKRKRQELGR